MPVKQEKSNNPEWQYQYVDALNRGLNVSLRSSLIQESELLVAKNVINSQFNVLKDSGYKAFGSAVRGNPRATYQFYIKTGSSYLILVTNDTFYVWNESDTDWHYVSDGTSTTIATAASATDTTIDVASISGFSDGDYIGIELDSGGQHQTTINGAPSGTTITLTDAMPSAAAIGNSVVKAVDLSGSDDIGVSLTTWPAVDKMYFANGVDTPKVFDGSTCEDVSGLPSNTAARIIIVFNNFLLVMHTTESGTAYPQRIRWTEPGDPTDWNASVNFQDLYAREDWITAADQIGPYLIVYKERSIVRMEYLGQLDQTWNFTPTIDAEGALNQDAVVNLGDRHLVFGNANIYEYDGAFDLVPVGDNIYDMIFGNSGELNPEEAVKTFGFYVEELDEVWYFYPSGNDEFPKKMLRYKLATQAWTTREFSVNMTGYGFFQASADKTWNDVTGAWNTQTYGWLAKETQANSPTVHLCEGSNNQVVEYDYIQSDDDGTAISYEVQTKDFFAPNEYFRFDRYEFFLRGTNVLVEASYDEGQSWETLGTLSPGSTFIRVRVWKQEVGRTIRFRFTGSEGFGLESLGFLYRKESIW